MKAKLGCIMLIDDNDDDNFFHERAIRKTGLADRVLVKSGSTEALDYLSSVLEKSQFPELIFLDINMPGMNGWEFMEAFAALPNLEFDPVIIMLSTSQNPDDILRAQQIPFIKDFRQKPLTQEMLHEIVSTHFTNRH